MTDMNDSTIQKHDHILFFSMGQHSYHVYFEAISKIQPTHVFLLSNSQIHKAGEKGVEKYKAYYHPTYNPSLSELDKKYLDSASPLLPDKEADIETIQIDGMIVNTLFQEISDTQEIINELHGKTGQDLLNIVDKKNNRDKLQYLIEKMGIGKLYGDERAILTFIPEICKRYPKVCMMPHLFIDESKDTVQDAITNVLITTERKWRTPHYSFHISAGRNQFILSLFRIAMWLDAKVYLSPRECGLQEQPLPELGFILNIFNEKKLAIFSQMYLLSKANSKTFNSNVWIKASEIYDSYIFKTAHKLDSISSKYNSRYSSLNKSLSDLKKSEKERASILKIRDDSDNIDKKINYQVNTSEGRISDLKKMLEYMKFLDIGIDAWVIKKESSIIVVNDKRGEEIKERIVLWKDSISNDANKKLTDDEKTDKDLYDMKPSRTIVKSFWDQIKMLELNSFVERETHNSSLLRLTEKGNYVGLLLKIRRNYHDDFERYEKSINELNRLYGDIMEIKSKLPKMKKTTTSSK